MKRETALRCAAASAIAVGMLAAFAPQAVAYVGPGAGLGMLASLLAVLLAVVATIVGLVLWPIRKLSRRKKAAAGDAGQAKTEDPPGR
jgi:hypothetical protein